MSIETGRFPSIREMQDMYLQGSGRTKNSTFSSESFGDILKSKADNTLKFSKHASNRLSQRNIELSDSQLARLNEGAKKAEGKGINESLVLVDRLAFIVNVPNSTVVTAMDQEDANENIFTNIDGAVIM